MTAGKFVLLVVLWFELLVTAGVEEQCAAIDGVEIAGSVDVAGRIGLVRSAGLGEFAELVGSATLCASCRLVGVATLLFVGCFGLELDLLVGQLVWIVDFEQLRCLLSFVNFS